MADLFIFKPHSVIDVITNSSSELFIVNKDKTVDVVEGFLKGLFAVLYESYTDAIGNVYTLDTEEDVQKFLEEYVGYIHYTPYVSGSTYEDMRDEEEKWLKENHEKNMKKYLGCTIIESAGDNSIPYDIIETIEDKLNAKRYHIG